MSDAKPRLRRYRRAGDLRPDGALAWVAEIRAALDEGRLAAYSQPILPLAGAEPREELLLRMVTREGDVLPPAAFIPAAEQFGVIGALDRWMFGRAVELAAEGRAVEVNISAATIGDDSIRAALADAIRDGLDPARITFEITETAACRSLELACDFARDVTDMGAGVALDDFGTGYGSLTYLRRLHITQIKLDGSYVRNVAADRRDARIAHAIIHMASELGLETVAEGVEDLALLDVLREMGADFAQGYAIAPPEPVGNTSVV